MHVVGSVIDIKGNKFVVCGHRPYDKDGMVGMGYLVVPYPLGFVNLDSFTLVPSDKDYPLVHEGYRNSDAQSYDQLLEQVRAFGSETTMSEATGSVDAVVAELREMAAELSGKE